MATWNDVRAISLALPDTAEDVGTDGRHLWAVHGKGFVWERPLRKSDLDALGKTAPKGPILGVRTPDLEMKDLLLGSDPRVFFTTPHFNGFPAVLVQLEKISRSNLKDVIVEAWMARAPKRAVQEFLKQP